MSTTKECMAYYFESTGEGVWKCRICSRSIRQKKNAGYSNLQSHILTHEPEYKSKFEEDRANGGGTLDSFGFINDKTKDMFYWMKWIVDRNLPLHEIEQKWTRSVVSMKSFSAKTLTKYLTKVTELVEKYIHDDLPEKFAIVFDGWTRHSVHYLAIFAVYLKNGQKQVVLLAIAPPINEESYNSDEHIIFIQETLNIYGKTLENVCCFVGDNCETNQSVSRKTGIALIGCYSHKLNLAVKKHLENSEEKVAVHAVHNLMVELRTLKNAARLRKLGLNLATLDNDTRWSSTYEMIKRYLEIIEFVETIEVPSVQDKLLTRSQHRMVTALMIRLKQMEDVTKELQREDLTLSEARDLFDGLMNVYPAMEDYLAERASIVVDPTFESAIIKVIRKETRMLTPSELTKLESFKKPPTTNAETQLEGEDENGEKTNFAKKLLKRRRLSTETHDYIDLSFIPPTSNIVERLFSVAKLLLRDQRARLLPITFESILFLKANMNWWNLQTVHTAMQSETQ